MRIHSSLRLSLLIAVLSLPAQVGRAGVLDGLLGGGSGGCTPQTCGSFGAPFVEPTLVGVPTSEKCLPDAEGELVCKPTAGTLALLQDGRALYWDALEGTERVQFSVIIEFGDKAANDQSRVLTLGPGDTPSWTQPTPVDGGANPGGTSNTPLLPGLNTNDAQGAGALFCSHLVQLADGRILAAGGSNYYMEPGIEPIPVGLLELEGLKNTRIFNPADDH
ncbi:MAG: galactose oxidase, partial [Myxococcota bacterium]